MQPNSNDTTITAINSGEIIVHHIDASFTSASSIATGVSLVPIVML
ncbi:MAG: hypothetical protein K2G21_02615 [Muribaculaceae bacterium]|nr:hypothetical protein [Muribaculaceae bacterium]